MFSYKVTRRGAFINLTIIFVDGSVGDYELQRIQSAIKIMGRYGLLDFSSSTFMDSFSKNYPLEKAEEMLNCFNELASKGYLLATAAQKELEPIIAQQTASHRSEL